MGKICIHSCPSTHMDTLKATFRNTILCEILRIVWEEHRAPARVLHRMATDAEDHVWRIERWRLGFRPQAYFPQQRSCEMTWHVASPPHPRAPPSPPPVENAMLDKGVCGDEQPIVSCKGRGASGISILPSHFDLEKHHLWQTLHDPKQRSEWRNQIFHLFPTLPFLFPGGGMLPHLWQDLLKPSCCMSNILICNIWLHRRWIFFSIDVGNQCLPVTEDRKGEKRNRQKGGHLTADGVDTGRNWPVSCSHSPTFRTEDGPDKMSSFK